MSTATKGIRACKGCEECNGTGKVDCPECDGSGFEEDEE